MGSPGVPLSDPPLPPELMNRGVSGGASHPPDLIRLLLPIRGRGHLIIYGSYRSEKGRKRFTSTRFRPGLAEL